ncbi:MAG: hypothetical protein GY795_19450 [Desulfobacterales bacterium]|nr:hypothetical protein [Desulfobacterales bacterium]
MEKLEIFNPVQMGIVNDSVAAAEELVSNFYKMSESQWPRYDIKTLADLCDDEIVHGHFAQVIPCEGKRKDRHLGSSAYDFYKICIQDHSILSALNRTSGINLFPFALYIVTHELVHIVRFCKFLQGFHASPEEITAEEKRVYEKTHAILGSVRIPGLDRIFELYNKMTNSS